MGRLADKLWSRLVRLKGKCEMCGKTERLQGAHGIGRTYRSTRWLPINGFCLCSGCHVRYTHDPIGWDLYLRKAWGELVYDELRATAQRVAKTDYEQVIRALALELQARGVPREDLPVWFFKVEVL